MKRPNYVYAAAPAFRHKVKGGAKVVAAYDHVYRAWAVGLVRDFYCGTRADDDDSIIWLVDGIEYELAEHARVRAHLDELAAAAGVASIEWGPTWCGYRGPVMTMADGRVIEQRWAGELGRVVTLVNGRLELEAVAS